MDFDWDDENGRGKVAGLVLGEIEEGTYERVDCFTTMGIHGMKYVRNFREKTVKLV